MRVVQGDEFKIRALRGLQELSDTVGCTMGTNGKNVMFMFTANDFAMTKDGVTVAESFAISRDYVAHAVSTFARQAAQSTNKTVGDGTTTATLLTNALYVAGLTITDQFPNADWHTNKLPKRIREGEGGAISAFDCEPYDSFNYEELFEPYDVVVTPREFRDTLDKIPVIAKEYFHHLKTKVKLTPKEVVRNVSRTSSNGDETIISLLVEAFDKVDYSGVVVTDVILTGETGVKLTEGFLLDSQPLHPGFLNQDTNSLRMSDPMIFVTDKYINNPQDVQKVLQLASANGKPFLLVCGDMDDSLINQTLATCLQSNIQGVVVKAPSFGIDRVNLLNDLCTITGAKFLSASGTEVKGALKTDAGTAPDVIVDTAGVKFINHLDKEEIQNSVNARIILLNKELENEDLSERTRTDLTNRISNLSGKFAKAVIKVSTEGEQKEVAARLTDALCAVTAALKEGCLPGGGVSYLLLAKHLAKQPGWAQFAPLFEDVFHKPLTTLLKNSDRSLGLYNEALAKLSEDNLIGIELRSMCVRNMMEAGIVDPVAVPIAAVECACSIVKTLLQTDRMISVE